MNLQLIVVASKECLQPTSILRLTVLASFWMIRNSGLIAVSSGTGKYKSKNLIFTSQFFGLNKGLISPSFISHNKIPTQIRGLLSPSNIICSKTALMFQYLVMAVLPAWNKQLQETLTFYFRSNTFIAQVIHLQLCWQ